MTSFYHNVDINMWKETSFGFHKVSEYRAVGEETSHGSIDILRNVTDGNGLPRRYHGLNFSGIEEEDGGRVTTGSPNFQDQVGDADVPGK